MRSWGGGVALSESRAAVDTWSFVRGVSFAVVESGIEAAWNGEATAQDIIDVLAVSRSVWAIDTCSKAEVVGRHETCPFVCLLVLSKGIREDQATFGVTQSRPGMGVQFSAVIIRHETHFRKVARAGDLDIRHLVTPDADEVCGGNGTLRDQAGTIAFLQAVRNDDLLNVTDLVGTISDPSASLVRRSPQAEIVHRIDVDVLTQGCLVAAGPTVVVPDLTWLFRLFGQIGGIVRRRVLCTDERQNERCEQREHNGG